MTARVYHDPAPVEGIARKARPLLSRLTRTTEAM